MPDKNSLTPYYDFVVPFYAGRDPGHGIAHIDRILNRLAWLSKGTTSSPRPSLLNFLACFHSLGRRLSADVSFREQVRAFLSGMGWVTEEIDQAFDSLARHVDNPQTVEERIVHDANAVEAVGALGIAKAFTTGGTRGQLIEDTLDLYESQVLSGVRFYTRAGQQYAEEKRRFSQAFIEQLRRELKSL